MFQVRATTNVEQLSAAMRQLSDKQLPFALALAATRTGQEIQKNVRRVMRQRFDRPTPTTLKSLYLKAARKAKPEARVWFRDEFVSGVPADKYLQAEVFGGQRAPKGLERALQKRGLLQKGQLAVPASWVQDQYGNVKRGLTQKIMSGLRVFGEQGYSANATGSKRSRKKGNWERWFVAEIDGTRGIWERQKSAMGDRVRPAFVFTDGPRTYRVRLPFFKIAENTVKAHYQRNFIDAIAHAVATARK